MITSTAIVPTANASRYLQQLCKHWSHNMAVEFDASAGRIVFPRTARGANWPEDGVVRMEAAAEHLVCHVDAAVPEQLNGLKGALERHLDRFAFREAPLAFAWQDGD